MVALFVLLAVGVVLALLEYYFYLSVKPRLRTAPILSSIYWASTLLYLLLWLALILLLGVGVSLSLQSLISWMILFIILNMGCKVLYFLFSLPFRWVRNPRWKRVGQGMVLCVILMWGVVWGQGIYSARHPQVRETELYFEDLPPVFDNYKIAFVTDLHAGVFGASTTLFDRTAELINQNNPDLIAVGGDWISIHPDELMPHQASFSKLKAPDGKWAIMGNHDYISYARGLTPEQKIDEINRLHELVEGMGFQWLDNQAAVITRQQESIVLLGVENWGEGRFGQHGDINKAKNGIDSLMFKILLSHNPEHFRRVIDRKQPIQLTLSGHTHAMQTVVTLFGKRWSPSVWFYPMWGGLYQEDGQSLYVSEGVGCALFAMRIGTPPEVTILRLRSKRN